MLVDVDIFENCEKMERIVNVYVRFFSNKIHFKEKSIQSTGNKSCKLVPGLQIMLGRVQ